MQVITISLSSLPQVSCPSSTIITISNEGGGDSGGGGGGGAGGGRGGAGGEEDGGDGDEWGDSAKFSKNYRPREREKRGERGCRKEEVTIGKKWKDRREKMYSKSQETDEISSRDKCRYKSNVF